MTTSSLSIERAAKSNMLALFRQGNLYIAPETICESEFGMFATKLLWSATAKFESKKNENQENTKEGNLEIVGDGSSANHPHSRLEIMDTLTA